MEVEDFLKIGRADCPEDQERINAAISDPSFLQFVLETLSNQEVRENAELLKRVLLAFTYFCRINFSVFIEALSDASIKEAFIQLLFALPPENRDELVHAFSTAASSDPEAFTEVIQQIIELITETTTLVDVHTILSIVYEFVKNSTNIGAISEIIHGVIGTIVQSAGAAVATDSNAFSILGDAASIIRTLLVKDMFPIDEVLTESISIFVEGLGVESEDPIVISMKESILSFFIAAIKHVYKGTVGGEEEEENDEEEEGEEEKQLVEAKAATVELFNESVTAEMLRGALSITKSKQSELMIDYLITLLYVMLSYNIAPEELCSEQFFSSFIIPASQLSSSDMADFNVNPNVYIETSFTDKNDTYITARTAAARFTRIAAKRYIAHYDPIELIVQFGEDPRETEGRMFLLCAYASVMIVDPELFEQIFNLLTTEIPPFLVATIIRFVSIIQPKEDPPTSSAVATHFILNSEDLVVGHAGVLLLNECLDALDDKIEELHGLLETPYEELFPKISELSEQLRLSLESDVMAKLFRAGGEEVIQAADKLIPQFFGLWNSSEEGDDIKYIDSIITVIDSVSAESGAMEAMQADLYKQITECIEQNPNCLSMNSLITAAAYITLKLPTTTPEMIQFIQFIIAFINESDSGVEFDESLVLLIGGAILHPDTPLIGDAEFIQALGALLTGVLVQKEEGSEEIDERSPEEIANALILAACVVKCGNTDFFTFIDNAIQIIATMDEKEFAKEDKTLVTFSAFYLFASAYIVDPDAAHSHFGPETAQLVIEHSKTDLAILAYRELKVCFITLSFFAKYNVPNAFDVAGDLAPRIFDASEAEEERSQKALQLHQVSAFYYERELLAFVPALPFPIDDFSEMEFYQEICESMAL